jgi:hypothetical protein
MAEFPKSFRQFTGEHAAVASAYKALGEACAKAGPLVRQKAGKKEHWTRP